MGQLESGVAMSDKKVESSCKSEFREVCGPQRQVAIVELISAQKATNRDLQQARCNIR